MRQAFRVRYRISTDQNAILDSLDGFCYNQPQVCRRWRRPPRDSCNDCKGKRVYDAAIQRKKPELTCHLITFHNRRIYRCDHLPLDVSELSFSWQPSDVLDATLAADRKNKHP